MPCPCWYLCQAAGVCSGTSDQDRCGRRFAELLVDAGGVQQLLAMPRTKHTFNGLSFAFFSLSAIPTAFERVVSRPDSAPLLGCYMNIT